MLLTYRVQQTSDIYSEAIKVRKIHTKENKTYFPKHGAHRGNQNILLNSWWRIPLSSPPATPLRKLYTKFLRPRKEGLSESLCQVCTVDDLKSDNDVCDVVVVDKFREGT